MNTAASIHSASSAGCRRALAQIEARELIMRLDGARIDLGRNSSDRHDVDAPRQLERERRLLFNQDYGQALAVKKAELFQNLFHQARRKAQRGLIEQKDFRIGHERSAEREHLLFTAGQ